MIYLFIFGTSNYLFRYILIFIFLPCDKVIKIKLMQCGGTWSSETVYSLKESLFAVTPQPRIFFIKEKNVKKIV